MLPCWFDRYVSCSCFQELEILRNFRLTGSSLKELPRCCPGLRVLCLRQLPWLEGGFLSALQQLEVCYAEHVWLISIATTHLRGIFAASSPSYLCDYDV